MRQLEPLLPALHDPGGPQGDPERPRRAVAAREREVTGEHGPGLGPPVERDERAGGIRPPMMQRRPDRPHRSFAPGQDGQIVESFPRPSLGEAKPGAGGEREAGIAIACER